MIVFGLVMMTTFVVIFGWAAWRQDGRNGIVNLTPEELGIIGREFTAAAERGESARVACDFDGFKASISRGTWSPPFGTRD